MPIGYGDSSHTADGKYIIASFRGDANLGWVVDLRSFLNLSELKYTHYAPQERRWRVAGNLPLYRNLMHGLSEAEVTIIDQERYAWRNFFRLRDAGAEFGTDFTYKEILASAAEEMLRESPLGLPDEVGMTPAFRRLAYNQRLLDGAGSLRELPVDDLSEVHQRSGGKYKDAVVLSARAHSMLSPSEFFELRWLAENPYMRAPLSHRVEHAGKLGHVFDDEHKKSLPILNELVTKIALASGVPPTAAMLLSLRQPVSEQSSHLSDHLQAADFAAGWAAEILAGTNSDFRALAAKVRWLSVNGILWSAR